MQFSRRDFLTTAGVFTGLAALSSELPIIARAAHAAKASAAEIMTKYVKSTCCYCVNFCGINARLENGVIRNIFPDEARADYYNVGICPKGVTGAFNTYNPYRIKTPLKRTNPKKGLDQDPGWKAIGWEEAFNEIAGRLKKIHDEDPRKLIWQHGHGKYLIGDKFPKAFAKAFGTPNLVHRTTTCEAGRHVADELTWGNHAFLPDLDHCNMLVNFGGNYFEAEQFSRWLDHATTRAKERGMKVVVVEPRMSKTAAKADEWIPIRPGKDAVLLLAWAKILIDEGLIDEDFLVNYTNSPELVGPDGLIAKDKDGKPLVWDAKSKSAKAFVAGVMPALKGSYDVGGKPHRTAFQVFIESIAELTPEHAEEITDVPAATIKRLALELGRQALIGATVQMDGLTLRHRPVALHTFRGLAAKQFGVQNWRAGLVVQMLLGSMDAVGGINLHSVYKKPSNMQASKAEYPPKRVDLQKSVYFPHGTHNVCQQVAHTVLDPKAFGLQYTPEMQIFYATNRAFSTADTAKQIESLKKTYNVVIDIVLTETATMADIVLPDLTYLESWHMSPTRFTPSRKHSAIRQPMTNAFNIPHDGYSIIWELAKRVGIRDKYIANINKNWKLKKHPMQAGRDYSAKEAVELLWLEATKGKHDLNYAMEHAFVGKKLKAKDIYMKGVEAKFKGPGKAKMKLYADELLESFNKVEATVKKHGIKNIDLDQYRTSLSPLPGKAHAFPTPHVEAKDYPFYLITYKRMYRNQSGNTSLDPILNHLGNDVPTDENFVLMNAGKAAEMGIKFGDQVTIETRVGTVSGRVRPIEGMRPDTVAVSYHYGQASPGLPDYAKKGIWINSVLESHPDPISGMESFNDTKCKLRKA